MSDRSVWEVLGGIVYFFLWWIILPAFLFGRVLWWGVGILRLQSQLRFFYSRTLGWVKMKLGFWQPIAYNPTPHAGGGYGSQPRWVSKKVSEKVQEGGPVDQTLNFTGRSFLYRVKVTVVFKGGYSAQYYRKLRAPRHKRAIRVLLPRRPKTITEWVLKIGSIESLDSVVIGR
jgi:hypothetical protein